MAFIDDIQSRDTSIFPVVEIKTPNKNFLTQLDVTLLIDLGFSGFPDEFPWELEEMIEGLYYKIDDEIIKVRAAFIDFWTNPYVVLIRGQLGTEVQAHSTGSAIYRLGWYNISTKDFTLDNTHYNPLLLSTPSIKESIDLENRKYKISNVSLKISNVEYNGLRFTDTQISLNTEVLIHWVSPSCTIIDDCYLAYKGTVRAITHDEKTCNIKLEDMSQSTLHRDVPIELVGTNEEGVLDKYKNKPKPMVYGTVDKSPCVVGELTLYNDGQISSDEINVIIDNDTSVTSEGSDPLYAYKDAYVHLIGVVETMFGYDGATQYEIDGNIITLKALFEGETSEGSDNEDEDVIPSNTISDNSIIGYELVTPFGVTPLRMKSATAWMPNSDFWYSALLGTQPVEGTPDSPTSEGLFRVIGTMFSEFLLDDWEGQSALPDGGDIWWERMAYPQYNREGALVGCVIKMPILGSSSYNDHLGKIRAHFKNWYEDRYSWADPDEGGWGGTLKYTTSFGGNTGGDVGYLADEIIVGSAGDYPSDDFGLIGEHNSYDGGDTPIQVYYPSELLFHCRNDQARRGSFSACVIEFYNLELDHYMLLEDMLKLDFYANDVQGRQSI